MFRKELKQELKNKIELCQSLLEKIYVDIGGNYSSLMSSLDEGLKKSREAAVQFKRYIFDSSDSVVLAVTKIESEVNTSLDQFRSLDKDAREIALNVEGSISLISNIRSEIDEVRKSTEIMQILAMKNVSDTVSVSEIQGDNSSSVNLSADSLQDKALASVEISDELFAISSHIQKDFNSISESLVQLSSTEENLCRLLEQTSDEKFEEIRIYIQDFVLFLETLEKDAAQIRRPLFSIMQNLQYQDILRQSLNHVSLFLEKIEELPDSNSNQEEHALDIYSLYEMVSEFSISIFYEARDRLNENVKDFETHTHTIAEIIRLIDEKRVRIVADHAIGKNGKKNKDSEAVSGLKKNFSKLVNNLEKSIEIEKLFDTNKSKLPEVLQKFREKNDDFDKLSKQLKRQLSGVDDEDVQQLRAAVISNFNVAFSDINRLLESLDNRIGTLSEGSNNLIDAGSQLSEKCTLLFQKNREMGANLKQSIDQLFTFIQKTQTQIVESVDSFSIFSEYFLKLIEKSYDGITALADYSKLLDESVEISREIGFEAAKTKAEILKKRDEKEWIVQNEDILELINRFTIFRHREKANKMTGTKMTGHDVGEGSISLF